MKLKAFIASLGAIVERWLFDYLCRTGGIAQAIYSLGWNTTVTTTGAPAADAQAGAGNNPRVMEFGVTLAVATASTYGLARSTNTPAQTGPVLVLAENYADPAGKTGTAVAWGTAPTVTNFFRRIGLPATIGAGVFWTFPRGLILQAATASLVLWNLAVNSANTNAHIVLDE